MRPSGNGQTPVLWLLFLFRLRKCFRLRYMSIAFLILLYLLYFRLNSDSNDSTSSRKTRQDRSVNVDHSEHAQSSQKCRFDRTEALLRYKSSRESSKISSDDIRVQPTIERLRTLFKILIANEDKYRRALDYLGVFRFSDLYRTLKPFANSTERLDEIYCLFQRFITVSDNGHIDISPTFLTYLRQLSTYLSDGFVSEHSTWKDTEVIKKTQKPVIILGANSRFYDTLQASMRTVNEFFKDYPVAIYDLGFDQNQLKMMQDNCERCVIIPFPFTEIESVAPHVRNLPNFAWKPIIVQDAVRRYGSIIYGDTSVRYLTSDFDRLLIDNELRGFSCRELPSHYLSCYTLSGTFSWFNETPTIYDDVYIAEAGFVAVTDNFMSRLVLKTWVTCALDSECISPSNSRTVCKRMNGMSGTHRFDQSAMVVVLSFYFFQSQRENEHTDPAPYDMFASIQRKVAEVRRFEGDPSYFTSRKSIQNTTTTKAP